jgi:histone acetyltransferase (RNA polymerase elongator complex component)
MAIIPIFVPHAGCPHQCVFCNQRTISGQKEVTVEEVRRQINRYLGWLKPGQKHEAAFYGGSFTGLPLKLQSELFGPVDELRAQGVITKVRLSTRPDYIDLPRLNFLKQHGVYLIELGVQSLDEEVLLAAERGHTVAQVYEAVSLIRQEGFQIGLQLMVGMPRQTMASVQSTVLEVCRLKPDLVRIYPLLVIKDTPLAQAYKQGTFVPLSLEEAVDQAAYVYSCLTEAGIKVIRIGLQPDEELVRNILDGPFHPAMGELVKGRAWRNQLEAVLKKYNFVAGDQVDLYCPVRLLSQIRGRSNSNLVYLRKVCAPARLILTGTQQDISGEPLAAPRMVVRAASSSV